MNKIIVSIVLAIVFIVAVNKVTDVIYYVEKPDKSAYQVASVVTVASTESSEKSSDVMAAGDILALLASANVVDGEKVFKNVNCLLDYFIVIGPHFKMIGFLFHEITPCLDFLESRSVLLCLQRHVIVVVFFLAIWKYCTTLSIGSIV